MNKIFSKIIHKTIGGRMKIGNFNIQIDRNQNLPSILGKYPDYGANLVRLAKVVHDKYMPLKVFDVGGNIGDTIAMLLSDNPNYEIFSVEGDKKYLKILTCNFGEHKTVHIYNNFLGGKNETVHTSVIRTGGTLKINPTNNKEKNTIEIITLDTLVAQNPECGGSKLFKVDTDGYDNQILRGAEKYLSEIKPVIYFEYDSKFLKENSENGLDIFSYLENLGYKMLVFFDNYGRLLLSVGIEDKKRLGQLERYINDRNGAFAYYDIVVFHSNDNDIAESFVKREEQRD